MELTEEQIAIKFREAERILMFTYCNRAEDVTRYWDSSALLSIGSDFSSCFVSQQEGSEEFSVSNFDNLDKNMDMALGEVDAFLDKCDQRDSQSFTQSEDCLAPEIVDGDFALSLIQSIREDKLEELELTETFDISQNMARHLNDLKSGFCSKIQLQITLQVPLSGERILLFHGCWILGKTGSWKCIEYIDENSLFIDDTTPTGIVNYIKGVLEVQTALAPNALVH
ncbi:MAG: hypothetical protein LBI63_04325 [Candidatus Ancillula sp.]|jgi:hypothetical protein|nr:hypothetical protein [Candidatus Ancillula sp.]